MTGRFRPTAYTVVAGLIFGWAVLVTLQHSWAGDMRLHLGTVHGLVRDPWSPSDPLVGASSRSPYYSPFMVGLGMLARWLKVAPITVLEWAGVVNVAFWLYALGRFCRNLSGRASVPALAAVFTLLLWGLHPREWSGFLGLYSLSWTMAYPSVFATALMLLIWDGFLRMRERPTRTGVALLVVAATLIVLIHPFTALNTVIGLAGIALARPSVLRSPWPYVVAVGGVALALLWPWSKVTSLFGAAGDFSDVHRDLILDFGRSWGFAHYGLALAGLPALLTAHRRPLGRELQVVFALAVLVIGFGAATQNHGFARVLPVAILPLHLALAAYLGTARWDWKKIVSTVVAVAACGVGLYGNRGGLIRAWWGPVGDETLAAWNSKPDTSAYDPVIAPIRPGMVVIPDYEWTGRLINGRGAYSVVPAWPYPFVNEKKRRADAEEFFAKTTTTEDRMKIVERYRIDCVIAWEWRGPLRKGGLIGFTEVARTEKGTTKLFCRQ